jgi:hypothetical protein
VKELKVTGGLTTSVNYRDIFYSEINRIPYHLRDFSIWTSNTMRTISCAIQEILMCSLRIWWTAICCRNPGSPLEKLFAGVILVHDYLYEAQAVLFRSQSCLHCLL